MGRVSIGLRPDLQPLDSGAIRDLCRGFWYLATVYTSHPGGVHEAYLDACRAATGVVKRYGTRVFCPIMHGHSMCSAYGIDGGLANEKDHEFWLHYDQPFMEAAAGMIVAQMPGWEESHGVTYERQEFTGMGKPILYLDWPSLDIVKMTRRK